MRLPDRSPATGVRVLITALDAPASDLGVPALLAETTTAPDGSFTAALLADAATRQLADRNLGVLNVNIVAIGVADGEFVYFASLGQPVSLLERSSQNSVTLTMEQVSGEKAAGTDCTISSRRLTTELALTKVAELHSWDDMTAFITNQSTSTHRIDIGASLQGGPVTIKGSAQRSEDKGMGVSAMKIGRYGRIWAQKFEYELREDRYSTPPVIVPGAPDCLVVTEITAQAINTGGGFADDSLEGNDPSFDVSEWDGPTHYSAARRAGNVDSYSSGAGAHKTEGLTHRYEVAAEVFKGVGPVTAGFSLGSVSEYSVNLRYDWRFGEAFPVGQSYHLWGANSTPKYATNVYAYSGAHIPDDATSGCPGPLTCSFSVQTSAATKSGPAGTSLTARGYCNVSNYAACPSGMTVNLWQDTTPSTQNKSIKHQEFCRAEAPLSDEKIGSVTFDSAGSITSGSGTLAVRQPGSYIICAGHIDDATGALWDNFTVT